ncbi:leucyl/phenylalanyl-tRNA--protein transferase [Marixanthomonas spongiae]|uniref:Leucyl/phenylalanyl-tRNA--protein transferase n=1 Tax=Marixanthomonas spongiae TaxID=2174845 RepID=A0A2U0HZ47_9FLAO|nr:leucyl/phenylalanyl-tRNA--protein transferase [Marixanthomonas spongiae]PVW14151.1 leucyl/phenylalanyl-tRNA--protein transferase [Marixanthomonas spongiae]
MHFLTEQLWFPSVTAADEDGLLAVGGDLSSERLLLAYQSGIFPWYSDGQPILWWSPDPRMVLFPKDLKVSKSFRKSIVSEKFRVTFNSSFSEVIENCATIKREGQPSTWITPEMQRAYLKLHQQGHAVSVEVWQDNKLVGGLYGIDLPEKKVFCGESMFTKVSDASKVGFYHLVQSLKEKQYKLIDCQVHSYHLQRLDAVQLPRERFMKYLD